MDNLYIDIHIQIAIHLGSFADCATYGKISRKFRELMAKHMGDVLRANAIYTEVTGVCGANRYTDLSLSKVECTERICTVFGRLHSIEDEPAVTCTNGQRIWIRAGLGHRGGGKPSMTFGATYERWCAGGAPHVDGSVAASDGVGACAWYRNGQKHRGGGKPQTLCEGRGEAWYEHDKLHRDNDLPASIDASGTIVWCQYGQIHREDDKPAFVGPNGEKRWLDRDMLHRGDDKPAHIFPDGTQVWYRYGLVHRDGGRPAMVLANGELSYWISGVRQARD
jgi:hypothetical protein